MQTPNGHMAGRGCPKCRYETTAKKMMFEEKHFFEMCKKVHKNKYDYSKSVYKGIKENITYICKEHGRVEQLADNHKRGWGCRLCTNYEESKIFISKDEKELQDFLKEHIKIETSNRSLLKGRELDIVIPLKKIAIEFNGLYWHREDKVGRYYHRDKTELTKKEGYQLIHIFEDEWQFKKDIVKKMLLHKLGLSKEKKIFARKCKIRHNEPIKDFLELNHIQGGGNSKNISLWNNGEMVAVMAYKNCSSNTKNAGKIELTRYATSKIVIGGFSKLLKELIKTVDKDIVSFADLTKSNGDVYLKNGFEEYYRIRPDYQYIIGKRRVHKFNMRKKNLAKEINMDNLTENEATKKLGYRKIYDSGKICYICKHTKKDRH